MNAAPQGGLTGSPLPNPPPEGRAISRRSAVAGLVANSFCVNQTLVKRLPYDTSPTVLEAFRTGGIASLSGTPAQFAEFIRMEIARYAEVIQRAHITAEG